MAFTVGDPGHVEEHNRLAAVGAIEPPYGGIYFTDNATSVISVAGEFVKAAGVTSYSSGMRHFVDDGGGVANRLRYTGTTELHFHAVAQASVNFTSGTNQVAAIQVYKWDASAGLGALIPHSLAVAVAPGQSAMQLTTHCDVMLDQGDYLELHVANQDGTNDLVVQEGYAFIMGMRRTV